MDKRLLVEIVDDCAEDVNGVCDAVDTFVDDPLVTCVGILEEDALVGLV